MTLVADERPVVAADLEDGATPDFTGVIRAIDHTGDTTVTWNVDRDEEIRAAS